MPATLTTDQVWEELGNHMFAVVGMVTAKGQSRTAGIVYSVHHRHLYFGSERDAWKTRHIAANPHVSMTATIAKRIPFMPWIRIPPATITFSGMARVRELQDAPVPVVETLTASLKDESVAENSIVIDVTPTGDFLTYGVGVPIKAMLWPDAARGRAPVSPSTK